MKNCFYINIFLCRNIYPKKRNGLEEYNTVLESLIQNEMNDWEYSRNSSDHDATYFFLPESSIESPSLYNYQYLFSGTGILHFFTFVLSQQATEERFPPLWPWIAAKIQPEEEVTITTHLLISQDVFTLSHTLLPTKTNEPIKNQQINESTAQNQEDLFGKIVNDPNFLINLSNHQLAYISDIRYGQQLLVSLNVTSKSPEAHPYFSKKLLHAVKDLMTESIPRSEFDELFPQVSFNLSLHWNPLTLQTRQGKRLKNTSMLTSISANELLDILESWRDFVFQQDPLTAYPIALQARSLRIRVDPVVSFNEDNSTTENHLDHDEIVHNHYDDENEHTDDGQSGNKQEKNKVFKTTVESGNIVNVHISRCAYGNLPPQSVMEMFWELSFLTTITAFSLVTVLSYFTLGGVVQQIVAQGQLRLPFFIHIHEVAIRLRFLYIWP